MCYVKIVSGVAVRIYRAPAPMEDGDVAITEAQFNACVLPCTAVVGEDGKVSFGDVIPAEEAPAWVDEGAEQYSVQTYTAEPTELERLRADVDYIALMTGVEL